MMGEHTHYSRAPITEAIIDLRVKPQAEVGLETLRLLAEDFRSDYPESGAIYQATGSLQVKPGVSAAATAHQEQMGIRCQTEDGQHICQLLRKGLTCSWLAPYDTWESFRDRVRIAWTKYREALDLDSVARLAVRYVNRIDIPHGSVELSEYFRTLPAVSPALPQTMSGFFMQVQLPLDDIQATAVINQTIVPPSEPDIISVILDIDLFRSSAVPQDEAEIWMYFETLHIRKNVVFEACITDKTRELFK